MTNQQFCYWLQGYFEIALNANLTKAKIILISESLKNINEPLGKFTKWLDDVVLFLFSQDCKQTLMDTFLPEIRDRLNLIFYHVIDNTYDTTMSREEIRKIHDGYTQ